MHPGSTPKNFDRAGGSEVGKKLNFEQDNTTAWEGSQGAPSSVILCYITTNTSLPKSKAVVDQVSIKIPRSKTTVGSIFAAALRYIMEMYRRIQYTPAGKLGGQRQRIGRVDKRPWTLSITC